jgi:hypothetical protein
MKSYLAFFFVAFAVPCHAVELELTEGVAPSPSPLVLNITGPFTPAGCKFSTSAAGITLVPGTNHLAASGEFNTVCQPAGVAEVISGPATARVGQSFVLTWQFRGNGFCTSGSGSDSSSFPSTVAGWPTSPAYPGATICGSGACGQTTPVSRSVIAGVTGLHQFRLVCYPFPNSDVYFVQSYDVFVTP